MQLSELITTALNELDHEATTEELALWEAKLKRFANEAQDDLFRTFRPWRRDPLTVQNGTIDLDNLSHTVSKVLGVERNGMRIPFYYGRDLMTLSLKGVPDGPVDVVYRYLPDEMTEPTDEPSLPAVCHPLIVQYMVARFEMHNDVPGLNHAKLLLSLYETHKHKLRMDFDEPSGYSILNNV